MAYDERDLHVEDGMYTWIMDRVEDEADELAIVDGQNHHAFDIWRCSPERGSTMSQIR